MTHNFACMDQLYQADLNPGPEETSQLDAFLIFVVIAGFWERDIGIPGAEVCIWKKTGIIYGLIGYSRGQTLRYQESRSPAFGRILEYIYWYIPGDRRWRTRNWISTGRRQVGTTTHFGNNGFPIIQVPGHKVPRSSLAEACVWIDEQRRSPIRSIGPLHAGRAGANATPPQLFTNRSHHLNWPHTSAFITFNPVPSIEFPWVQFISHDNCPPVAFSPLFNKVV